MRFVERRGVRFVVQPTHDSANTDPPGLEIGESKGGEEILIELRDPPRLVRIAIKDWMAIMKALEHTRAAR